MPLNVEHEAAGAKQVRGQDALAFAVEAGLFGLRMFNVGAVIAGTALPTAGGRAEIEWRVQVVRTANLGSDASGNIAVTFPTAFPRGLYGLVVSCDTGSNVAAMVLAGTEALTGFTARVQASISCRVFYVAVGY